MDIGCLAVEREGTGLPLEDWLATPGRVASTAAAATTTTTTTTTVCIEEGA